MAWSKPLDEVELAYIEKSFPARTCAEIAAKLGRSKRCVEKAVARLGLRDRDAGAQARDAAVERDEPTSPDDDADELADLLWLKRQLKREIRSDPGPAAKAKLSQEFQSVVKRIAEIRGGDYGGGRKQDPAAALLGIIDLRSS